MPKRCEYRAVPGRLQKLLLPYRCELQPSALDGSTRLRLLPGAQRLPVGWVRVELELVAPGAQLSPRFFAGDGQRIVEAPALMSSPDGARHFGIVHLPQQVSELFLEPGCAAGACQAGPVRMRELSKAELASRLGARLLSQELASEDGARPLIRTAREVFQARGRRWSMLKGRVRQQLFPPRVDEPIEPLRKLKMERLRPCLLEEMPHQWRADKVDFLTEELRRESAIAATDNVSSNGYDHDALGLIEACRDGLVLDCGAGRRDRYFANVVNFEIVDYDSTDVLGVGERLPFRDGTFDAVLSLAVLEHVRDPFRCAAEIVRVLKPGGKLMCCVPFLQPLHGYPHHYFNMSHQGLRSLFERSLHIDRQEVPPSVRPVWSLAWIVQSWAQGLPTDVREHFLDLPLRSFLRSAEAMLDEPFVRKLSEEKNFELASATVLFATKPLEGKP